MWGGVPAVGGAGGAGGGVGVCVPGVGGGRVCVCVCPGVRGGGGVGWGGGGGVEGVRARGCVPGVGGECVCVCGWVGGCPGGLGWRSGASGQCGAVWGQCLRAARWDRPALPWGLAGLALGLRGSPAPGPPLPPLCRGTRVLEGRRPPAALPAQSSAVLSPRRAPGEPWAGPPSVVPGRKTGAGLQGHWPEAGDHNHGGGGWGVGGGVGGAARGGVGWGGVELGGNLPAWGVGGGPGGCLGRESRGPEHSKEPHRQPNGPGPLPPTRGLEGGSGRARSLLDAALSVRRWTPRTVPLAGHAITAAPRRGAPQAREKERPGGSRGAPSRMRLPGAG